MLHAIVKAPFFRAAVRCLAAASLVFAAPGARAQEPLVPLPSVKDFTRGGGLGLAAGGSFEYAPAYSGADQYDREWRPSVALQWRDDNLMVFWENHEAGLRALLSETMLAQISAVRLEGREARDSEDGLLNGLDKRDDEYAGAVEFRKAISRNWRHWVGARAEAGGNDAGALGAVSYGFHAAGFGGGMGAEAIFFVTFADADHLNRHFGVTEAESMRAGPEMIPDPKGGPPTAGGPRLPPASMGSGYRSVGLKIIHRRDISRRWHLIVEGGAEVYRGNISNSPVTRASRDFNGGATLLYQF